MIEPAVRPVVLVVRDGWGANPYPQWNHANAVFLAETPVDDRIMRDYPHVQIITCGEDVGLPAGIAGNSEVGHQNIGAGRVVNQELMRITQAIRDRTFFENEALLGAFRRAQSRKSRVHLLGLCSSAGVHSTLDHCYALLEMAERLEFPSERLFVHCIGDGRDTPPKSGKDIVCELESKMRALGMGSIASVIGRYYAMDRDSRWDRVAQAYQLLTAGRGQRCASAAEAFQRYYDQPSAPSLQGDEFIAPTVMVNAQGGPRAVVDDGDSVIFFNFRGDRPRELTQAFVLETFPFHGTDMTGQACSHGFDRGPKLDLCFCTLTEYETDLPVQVAFRKPPKMSQIIGAYVSDLGLRQYRTAETEKFPHVTYFFNDYRDDPLDGEDRFLVPSPRDVATYDLKPEMSAAAVTAGALQRIEEGIYDFIVINYANPDMVGHTGNLQAAIQAVQTVDECVGRIIAAVLSQGGGLVVTADHGNCEQMIDPDTQGPHTSHTVYDVELAVVDDRFRGRSLRRSGRLADVAPTLLVMMGLEQPDEMTGQSLIRE